MIRRTSLSSALVVSLVSLLLAGCSEGGTEGPEGARHQAPGFELIRLDGLPVSRAQHRGKTVILDFWATWCAPCEVQMPVLDKLWEARGGPDLMILGISVDTDPADEVIEWVKERKLDYPIAIANQDLALEYGVIGFPTLVVIDPEGGIHTRHTGVLSRPELEEILEEIAREPRIGG